MILYLTNESENQMMKEEYKDFIGIYDENVPVDLCNVFVENWEEGKKNQTIIDMTKQNETGYWKKYTGINGLNFGINNFGKSAPYKEIYNHFNLNTESIIKKIKEKI